MATGIDVPESLNGWTYRQRVPREEVRALAVLLHGWKGDESSMRVFANLIPETYAILMPRAPFIEPQGGFTWREILPGSWGLPTLADLRPSAEGVLSFVDAWIAQQGFSNPQIDIAGFSQGAAMAYTMTLLHPERIRSLVACSGFLPEGSQTAVDQDCLRGKQVLIAHGSQDELIPLERAYQAAASLRDQGATVSLCESRTGHKIGRECFQSIKGFYERMI